MPPDEISGLLREAIENCIDEERFEHDRKAETKERQSIARALPAPSVEP
jgi:hypothetical protein